MKTSDIRARLKADKKKVVGERSIQRWAADNGVSYTGEGKRKEYEFTEEDYQRFKGRASPGRPWEQE
jgi:hypothetical protein